MGWQWEERPEIYCYPEGENLAIDNVLLSDGNYIKVLIAPLTVNDDKFIQSLADENGHESNVKLIAHLCVGWGDREYVQEGEIESEFDAVRDVAGAIASFLPKSSRIVKGRKNTADGDLQVERRKLSKRSGALAEATRIDSVANGGNP